MAIVPQNVANNPIGSYPVGVFRATIAGKVCELQGVVLVDSSGTEITSGLILPNYDFISVAYPLTTQEVYTFKTGGSGGITVATVTVNYTDATKNNISTVAKT